MTMLIGLCSTASDSLRSKPSAALRSLMSRAIFEAPGLVADRRDGDGNVDASAILAEALGLEVLDRFAAQDCRVEPFLFVVMIARYQLEDGLADDLFGRVAEDRLRRPVPTGDDTVEGLADDGVFRRFDDGGHQHALLLQALFRFFLGLAQGFFDPLPFADLKLQLFVGLPQLPGAGQAQRVRNQRPDDGSGEHGNDGGERF
jgi:hypothetical protein